MKEVELAIKLPKDKYDAIIKECGLNAIKNGIWLPKKHRVYGLTIASSDGNWLAKLFTNKDERLDYAVAQMKSIFAACDFEDGMDEDGQTEEALRLDLEKGNNIFIQGSSERYAFEFCTYRRGN